MKVDWLPRELVSAIGTAKALRTDENRSSSRRSLIATAMITLLGCVPGYWVSPHLSPPTIAIVVTMFSILTGFLLNLMVTTGKLEGLAKRTFDEASMVVQKLRFLLWCHSLTFGLFLTTIILAIARAVLVEFPDAQPIGYTVGMLACGTMVASLVRALLLPYQMAELHLTNYEWTLVEIRNAEQEKVREQFRSKSFNSRQS